MEEYKKPENPSVYPWNEIDQKYSDGKIYQQFQGLSLRDKFAGQALVGILSGNEIARTGKKGSMAIAVYAYSIADAMLTQREL